MFRKAFKRPPQCIEMYAKVAHKFESNQNNKKKLQYHSWPDCTSKGTDHFYLFYRVSSYYYYYYFCMISSMGSLGGLKKTLFQAFRCRKNPGTYLNCTLAQVNPGSFEMDLQAVPMLIPKLFSPTNLPSNYATCSVFSLAPVARLLCVAILCCVVLCISTNS